MSLLADLDTLRRAGVLRPLGPRTTAAVGRQLLREGVSSHLVYTLHGTRHPRRPALVFEGKTTTWSELLGRVRRLANHLLERGCGPDSAVAVMLPNRPEFVETEAAALRIGATTSFVNPRAPAPEARVLIERTDARLCVTHREDLGDQPVLRVPDDYERALAIPGDAEPAVSRSARGKVVIFTSGTTGRPKGAVRSLDRSASLGSLAGFLRTIPFHTDDVHMVVCPLYHSSGSGFATVAQVLGNPLVIVERFSPEAFCRHVADHRVTTTAVVPTMLHQLTRWDGAADHDLSSLRVVVCTGAPLRPGVRERARELLGDVVYDLYGSTEMGWVSVATPDDQRTKPGTVGRIVPGVEVRILGEDGHRMPSGAPGEVWASSDMLMDGYHDDPELDAERMRDGFISVRDIGYLDPDGYLFLVDRADDMIISGGVNVYPAETETALDQHPAVRESAVVGVTDERWGERIVALVVAADTDDPDPDELMQWCREHVSYAAVPKEVRFAPELPRNDIGKVDKRRIATEW